MGLRWDALFFGGFVFLASVLSAIPLRAQDAEVTKSGAVAGESTAAPIRFSLALPAVVRVLDAQGQPVEGVPVRRHHGNMRSVAHNTDAKGEAHFYVYPNSKGRFAVDEYDFPKRHKAAKGKNLSVKYTVADMAPEKPFEITLTDEQKELLFKTPQRGLPTGN